MKNIEINERNEDAKNKIPGLSLKKFLTITGNSAMATIEDIQIAEKAIGTNLG
jgi:hypothetical protein